MKKRILFLINTLRDGGAERVLVELVNHLSPEEFDVEVRLIYRRGAFLSRLASHVKLSWIAKEKTLNKLYRKNFIMEHELLFPQGISMLEDMLFNLEVIKRNASFLYLPEVATHYVQRQRETLGTKYHPDIFALRCKVAEGWGEVIASLGAKKEDVNMFVSQGMFSALISAAREIVRARSLTKVQKKEKLNQLLDEEKVKLILDDFTPSSPKGRIRHFLFRHKLVSILFYAF